MQATQSLGEDLVEDDRKRLSFYFSVYIEGSPPAARRTLGPYAKGEDPQMFPHSHKKDSCLRVARFLYYSPWILLRFGNTLGLSRPQMAHYLRRTHSVQEPEPMSTPGSSTTTWFPWWQILQLPSFWFGLLQICDWFGMELITDLF
jgi:hypothetical protein